MKQVFTFLLALVAAQCVQAQFTYKVFDIDTRPGKGSEPSSFTVFKNEVYFFATDSLHGTELRKCDGNSVSLVADMNPGIQSSVFPGYSKSNKFIAVVGDTLYFSARDSSGTGNDIYKYDGINPPSKAINLHYKALPSPYFPDQLTTLNNKLYFIADTGSFNPAIVVYNPLDGTSKYINMGGTTVHLSLLFGWKNRLYFQGVDAATGGELYYYDW